MGAKLNIGYFNFVFILYFFTNKQYTLYIHRIVFPTVIDTMKMM
ncbi:hypothetical protein BOVA711_5459 [Bacteroides ovatus]|nr:hypothetical protein BOVA711_5459 [Bacteroides ovatus]